MHIVEAPFLCIDIVCHWSILAIHGTPRPGRDTYDWRASLLRPVTVNIIFPNGVDESWWWIYEFLWGDMISSLWLAVSVEMWTYHRLMCVSNDPTTISQRFECIKRYEYQALLAAVIHLPVVNHSYMTHMYQDLYLHIYHQLCRHRWIDQARSH